MSNRLSINELDFLKMLLRNVERIGNESLMKGIDVSNYGQSLVAIFGRTTVTCVQATEKISAIRSKVENLLGE
jgi:hypothetical protein